MRRLSWFFLVAGVAWALAGCDDGGSGACGSSSDCPGGQLCVSGTCRTVGGGGCVSDGECGAGRRCEDGHCVAAVDECAVDADCVAQPGGICDDGECSYPAPVGCQTDADCPGQVCDRDTGACEPAPDVCAGGCDDGDPCTDDTCDAATGCVHDPVAACCVADGECDDGNPCTADACVDHACAHAPAGGAECCSADAECDDGDDECTTDRCLENVCVHASTGLPGCCLVHADCVSDDPCEAGACRADGQCSFAPVAGCCRDAGDCDDGDYCTDDVCTEERRCSHEPNGAEGCCVGFEYLAGFDSAAHGWTLENSDAEVGWQVDAHRVHGGAASLYYGDPPWYHYDATPPAATHGTATSPPLTLPAGQPYRLRLHLLVDVRSSAAVDRLQVRVVDADGDTTAIWTRDALAAVGGTTGGAFLPIVLALDAFAGRTIRLQVAFDTTDVPSSEDAGREGVYLDSLSLTAACGR